MGSYWVVIKYGNIYESVCLQAPIDMDFAKKKGNLLCNYYYVFRGGKIIFYNCLRAAYRPLLVPWIPVV